MDFECVLKDKCKRAESCSLPCYPYTVMYGLRGDAGYWNSKNMPKKYNDLTIKDLPIEQDNPVVYKMVHKYVNNVLDYVLSKNLGLFLYSIHTQENRLGTGTGKTTTACIIANEYLRARIIQTLQEKNLVNNPVFFIRLAEFQNKYNEQFRGTREKQEQASNKYYQMKDRMKTTELLVIDDIAVRDCTEAFQNELFDIIDHRAVEELTTIFTSNYPLKDISEILGDRTVSRIDGMASQIGFKGKDHRKRGI